MTATTWLRAGQEVVVIYGRHQAASPVLTIDRVLERDVVLSNGDRWSQRWLSPNGEHIIKRGPTAWDPSSALFPADHPRVEQARREQSERVVVKRIESLAHSMSDAVRAGRWDDAHRSVTALVPLLAERAENGSTGDGAA